MKAYFFGEQPKGYSYQWHVKFSVVGELTYRECVICTTGKSLTEKKMTELLRRKYGKIASIIRAVCD